jgi:sec-independent protein translocase protein TatB
MFGIGFWEVALCLLIALLVLGPERLPGVARAWGRWVARARRYLRQMTEEWEQETGTAQWREEVQSLRDEIADVKHSATDFVSSAGDASESQGDAVYWREEAQRLRDELEDVKRSTDEFLRSSAGSPYNPETGEDKSQIQGAADRSLKKQNEPAQPHEAVNEFAEYDAAQIEAGEFGETLNRFVASRKSEREFGGAGEATDESGPSDEAGVEAGKSKEDAIEFAHSYQAESESTASPDGDESNRPLEDQNESRAPGEPLKESSTG